MPFEIGDRVERTYKGKPGDAKDAAWRFGTIIAPQAGELNSGKKVRGYLVWRDSNVPDITDDVGTSTWFAQIELKPTTRKRPAPPAGKRYLGEQDLRIFMKYELDRLKRYASYGPTIVSYDEAIAAMELYLRGHVAGLGQLAATDPAEMLNRMLALRAKFDQKDELLVELEASIQQHEQGIPPWKSKAQWAVLQQLHQHVSDFRQMLNWHIVRIKRGVAPTSAEFTQMIKLRSNVDDLYVRLERLVK